MLSLYSGTHIKPCVLTCHLFVSERLSLVTSPLNLEENLFFELVEPREIAYAYKIRPAKDFGTAFVSVSM